MWNDAFHEWKQACAVILTLTFTVQSFNDEQLRNTSSWTFVSGFITADLQETQWKFWLWGRKPKKQLPVSSSGHLTLSFFIYKKTGTYVLSANISKLPLPQWLQAGQVYAVFSSTPTITPADRNKTIIHSIVYNILRNMHLFFILFYFQQPNTKEHR